MTTQTKRKVAVLYSGQARTWKTCLENSKKFYESIDNTEVDFFYHTWDATESVQVFAQQGKIVHDKLSKDEINTINEILEPKMYAITSTPDNAVFQNRWMNLFYSLTKTINMMKEYAFKNNIKYDLVIKTRFDVIHNPITALPYYLVDMGRNPFLMTSHCNPMPIENYSYNFSDVVFYGSMYTFDLLANLFFERQPFISDYIAGITSTRVDDFNMYDGPGVMIYKYMVKHNVRLHENFDLREYIVRENNEMNACHTDGFQYYKRKHKQWYGG